MFRGILVIFILIGGLSSFAKSLNPHSSVESLKDTLWEGYDGYIYFRNDGTFQWINAHIDPLVKYQMDNDRELVSRHTWAKELLPLIRKKLEELRAQNQNNHSPVLAAGITQFEDFVQATEDIVTYKVLPGEGEGHGANPEKESPYEIAIKKFKRAVAMIETPETLRLFEIDQGAIIYYLMTRFDVNSKYEDIGVTGTLLERDSADETPGNVPEYVIKYNHDHFVKFRKDGQKKVQEFTGNTSGFITTTRYLDSYALTMDVKRPSEKSLEEHQEDLERGWERYYFKVALPEDLIRAPKEN